MFGSHGGFLMYSMHHHRDTIKSNEDTGTMMKQIGEPLTHMQTEQIKSPG